MATALLSINNPKNFPCGRGVIRPIEAAAGFGYKTGQDRPE